MRWVSFFSQVFSTAEYLGGKSLWTHVEVIAKDLKLRLINNVFSL